MHQYVGGQETLLVPRDLYRGYWGNDPRTSSFSSSATVQSPSGMQKSLDLAAIQPLAVSLEMVMLSRRDFNLLGGLDTEIKWPKISFIDFCLRVSFASSKVGVKPYGTLRDVINIGVLAMPHIRGRNLQNDIDQIKTFGISALASIGDASSEVVSNYDGYNLDRLNAKEAEAMQLLTAKHLKNFRVYARMKRKLSFYLAYLESQDFDTNTSSKITFVPVNPIVDIVSISDEGYDNEARLAWTIHCGGSQGFEAATILQSLDRFINVRSIVRGYRHCEHADTISDMPRYFQDIYDASAFRSFVSPNASFISGQSGSSNANSTDINQLDIESGEVSLYARDYRELGRWIPDDSSYVIGNTN